MPSAVTKFSHPPEWWPRVPHGELFMSSFSRLQTFFFFMEILIFYPDTAWERERGDVVRKVDEGDGDIYSEHDTRWYLIRTWPGHRAIRDPKTHNAGQTFTFFLGYRVRFWKLDNSFRLISSMTISPIFFQEIKILSLSYNPSWQLSIFISL